MEAADLKRKRMPGSRDPSASTPENQHRSHGELAPRACIGQGSPQRPSTPGCLPLRVEFRMNYVFVQCAPLPGFSRERARWRLLM
jgi:hypothetical protein